MKAAIVGLPQSGKTTLFSAVTGLDQDPYAQPSVRRAMVRVPDSRLTYLTELCKPKKVIEATIEFLDVPGCSLDDSKGRDDWRRMLPEVRKADVLVVVVRDFENPQVPAYRNRVDPKADFAEMWDELIFADLEAVTNRVERLEKALKKPTKSHDTEKRELEVLLRCRTSLEAEQPLSAVIVSEDDRKLVASFAFLTEKSIVAVRNLSDDAAGTGTPLEAAHAVDSLALSASIEAEISKLEPSDQREFLDDLGIKEAARERLIQVSYKACGLISFLTMGPDEVRAWTIRAGSTAVGAAGAIHSDLAQGFIRAETVAFDDLVTYKDEKGAKAAGKYRKEGKSYIVNDGDILNILSSA